MDKGYVDGVDDRVLDFFPDRTFANLDPRKKAMTLEHLLTMSSGLDYGYVARFKVDTFSFDKESLCFE